MLNLNWWSPFPDMIGVDGIIEIEDGVGINNTKGLKIGKINDNTGFATNALDLHLNLSNQTNVEMTFWIADWFDETAADDGIYFSDDGGGFFVKVLDFRPSEWCDNLYGLHPPLDVDKLASAAGLSLTNQFIIRFQQRGEDDFSGASPTTGDGFYLDDVNVTGMTTSTSLASEKNEINIYPIPSKNQINIAFTQLSSNVKNIVLYNSLGVRLYNKEINNQSLLQIIDISLLPTGMYYLSIKFNDGSQITRKIVKE